MGATTFDGSGETPTCRPRLGRVATSALLSWASEDGIYRHPTLWLGNSRVPYVSIPANLEVLDELSSVAWSFPWEGRD